MKITLPLTNAASHESVVILEEKFGNLPASYCAFLNQYDGAIPEENVIRLAGERNVHVEKFIAAIDIIEVHDAVEGFSEKMLPFASVLGGNFLYLNLQTGFVYFWDHEDECDAKMADSFDEFLAALEKFDIEQIKLKPGQVKKMWVNQDFKPTFE